MTEKAKTISHDEIKDLNVYQRLNLVQRSVNYIKKEKEVDRYKAVTRDQVVAIVRQHIVEHGIIIYPEQLSGSLGARGMKYDTKAQRDVLESMRMYEGDYLIHFVNIDNPADRLSCHVQAHAQDNGDKGPGKAATYAEKTAILKVLLLETGEDDESRVEDTLPITPAQVRQLTIALENNEALIAKFCEEYGIQTLEELGRTEFAEALIYAQQRRNDRVTLDTIKAEVDSIKSPEKLADRFKYWQEVFRSRNNDKAKADYEAMKEMVRLRGESLRAASEGGA